MPSGMPGKTAETKKEDQSPTYSNDGPLKVTGDRKFKHGFYIASIQVQNHGAGSFHYYQYILWMKKIKYNKAIKAF